MRITIILVDLQRILFAKLNCMRLLLIGFQWLNGEEVMKHSGGHLPFEADITSKLLYDKTNRITAAVNNTLTPSTLPPGAVRYLEGDMYVE